MAEYDWVRATDRCRRQVMSLQEADEFLARNAERLASLQAERDALQERLVLAQGHGFDAVLARIATLETERDEARAEALAVAAEIADGKIAEAQRSHAKVSGDLLRIIDERNAQLALRDAVVEAARTLDALLGADPAFQRLAEITCRGAVSMRESLADLDASENPRGATP